MKKRKVLEKKGDVRPVCQLCHGKVKIGDVEYCYGCESWICAACDHAPDELDSGHRPIDHYVPLWMDAVIERLRQKGVFWS